MKRLGVIALVAMLLAGCEHGHHGTFDPELAKNAHICPWKQAQNGNCWAHVYNDGRGYYCPMDMEKDGRC